MDVQLRPVQDDDLPLIFAWHTDAASVQMAGVPPRERPAFDAHWAKIRADPDTVLRTALVDGEPGGYLLCFLRDGQRELGYWVAREHWGRGVASAAVAAFLEEYQERPLSAVILTSNVASRRVLDKAGFSETSRTGDEVHLRLD
jgi:RimJ/RimL family protein N-acetyltransferase